MFRHQRNPLRKILTIASILSLVLMALGACGSSAAGNTSPIKIGVSLSLTGDFSADGLAFQQGYQLWADHVNANGGILGRKVTLDIVDDASSDTQTTTNYQKLITQDKVDLTFGPFSTLLTKPASVVAARYGYALVEGAGGGPTVFNRGLNNVFDVSLPVANNLVSFTQLMNSLPAGQKPATAAYATEDDPFTQPQVDLANQLLTHDGITAAAQEIVYPAETTDFTPIAQKLILAHADIVVLGTLLPDVTAFIQAFKQQHYNPKAIIATAGPDQGATFLQGIGGPNDAEAIMVPNGWFAEANNPGNAQMVQAYVAKYGGTFDGISADVPEAYSVGEVVQQAVTENGSLDQAKLIQKLHSGTFTSVQGTVKFDSTGQNTAALSYLFQWQGGNLVPIYPAGTLGAKQPEYPKPNWP
ncbi:MAG TPA: amino acid ABC transporter substrate-binding protein [Ktedonobacterales bacterium]|nr:amino acid ABC transporter substrate-binding protein [Ktedonobacterales bacterium]